MTSEDDKPYLKSGMVGKVPEVTTLKAKIFSLLDKNPLLSASHICSLLGIRYNDYKAYVWKVKSQWKTLPQSEQGSNCSFPDEYHAWHGWTLVPRSVVERYWGDKTLTIGKLPTEAMWHYPEMFPFGDKWLQTKARNRWILWKDRLGRLQLHVSGRIVLYVRKPAAVWKMKQLLAHGLMWTGLVEDQKIFDRATTLAPDGDLRFSGAHFVFNMGMRLPQKTIDYFKKSNGVVIKVGDRSHPDKLEIIASQPNWGERTEFILDRWSTAMDRFSTSMEKMTSQMEKLTAEKPTEIMRKPERLWYVG